MKSKKISIKIPPKDNRYREWLSDLKQRIRQSQIKAAVRVNSALIELYWNLGAEIVTKQAESIWGSGIIEQLSADLRTEFPNMQGFSETNLWYIKKFYLFYCQQNTILQQLVGELHSTKLHQVGGELHSTKQQQVVTELQTPKQRQVSTKLHSAKHQQVVGKTKKHKVGDETKQQQVVTELQTPKRQNVRAELQSAKQYQVGAEIELPQFVGQVPWGHHIVIITKCKSVDEAVFYLRKTVDEGWSRAVLVHHLEANLYKTQGKAITNFHNTLPDIQCDLAKEILKEPYCFDFLTLTVGYKEKELEDALTQNITKFLLELGRGFAFVGRQVEMSVGNSSFFVDMLFYNIRLKCFVVVELKTVNFEPEFAGKLNFYVTAVDRQMRGEDDNATIGLLICKTKDDVIVEYSLSDIHKPVGVSSYEMSKILPLEFQSSLPSIEEIEAELEGIEQKTTRKKK